MKTTRSVLCTLTAGLALLSLAGCGDQPRATSAAGSTKAPAAASAPAQPAEGRPVEITGNDTMKFNVETIRAQPGEALAVTLRNIGTMPKFSMGHNWVLLDAGTDLAAFANAAASAAKTDYLPASAKDQILAATKLLGPKESDTVVFTAPTKPGRYVYLCSFPGHYQVGMKGELIVE